MSSAERIIFGVASVIALIGWLRLAGEAGTQDDELRNRRPTSPIKYRRPSNESSEANRQIDYDIANLTPEAQVQIIDANQTNYENAKLPELMSSERRE